MCKKLTFGVIGLIVLGGVLFGSNMVPYVTTAVGKARRAAQRQVPISFQIDAAEEQLEKIRPEVHEMVWQIAKEKAQIKRLETELVGNQQNLKKSHTEMMTLRDHLGSGEQFYTAANAKTYTNSRVKEDLAHRFALYKTAQQTVESQQGVLESRKSAVEAALAKLEEAQALQRELQVKIENLRARNRVNEVHKTASNIEMDNSELAKTARMVQEIDARIEADSEMLQLAPKYFGQIPVSEDSVLSQQDILQEMDEYFARNAEAEVVKN